MKLKPDTICLLKIIFQRDLMFPYFNIIIFITFALVLSLYINLFSDIFILGNVYFKVIKIYSSFPKNRLRSHIQLNGLYKIFQRVIFATVSIQYPPINKLEISCFSSPQSQIYVLLKIDPFLVLEKYYIVYVPLK